MTVMQAPPVDEVLSRAREIRFSTVVLASVLWLFWFPGWAAGRTWLALCFLAVAVRRGWRDGTGKQEQMVPRRLVRSNQVLSRI